MLTGWLWFISKSMSCPCLYVKGFPSRTLNPLEVTLMVRLVQASFPTLLCVHETLQLIFRLWRSFPFFKDTPLAPANSKVSHTASTTIMVNIVDVDNRPPWFHPCNRHVISGILICQSPGYTGRIVLNELQVLLSVEWYDLKSEWIIMMIKHILSHLKYW